MLDLRTAPRRNVFLGFFSLALLAMTASASVSTTGCGNCDADCGGDVITARGPFTPPADGPVLAIETCVDGACTSTNLIPVGRGEDAGVDDSTTSVGVTAGAGGGGGGGGGDGGGGAAGGEGGDGGLTSSSTGASTVTTAGGATPAGPAEYDEDPNARIVGGELVVVLSRNPRQSSAVHVVVRRYDTREALLDETMRIDGVGEVEKCGNVCYQASVSWD